MSDERTHEFGEEDFGGGERVKTQEVGQEEEEMDAEEEFRAENEEREEEEFVAENECGEIDRLSELPDPLLIHILTLLDLKKPAITSVLSKRWQYLWADLPGLRFKESSTQRERTRQLVSWVHRTLVLRSVNYLDKFTIEFAYDKSFASDVNTWVEFAVKNKVKRLYLHLHSCKDFYTLPLVMYSASSLTWLLMERCILAPYRTIDWRSLTSLWIEDVELDENVIEKILSGCPVLRGLSLIQCWGFECLQVNSPSLYSLGVTECEDEDTGPLLEISAPYIRSLDISIYPIGRKKLRLTNIPSLVRADIHFDLMDSSVEAMNNTMELFEDIKHVEKLELGCQCIEVISELVVKGWQLPQSKRVSLKIDTWRDENYISGIVGLLESSSNLKTLDIQCCDSFEGSVRTWVPTARSDLDCDLLHLKTVDLINYADPNLGGEPMLTMAQILLKRATTLEKMVIEVEEFIKFSSSSEFNKIAQTVLSYPRSSQKAVVVFLQ